MKKSALGRILPHLIAVVIFLIVATIYCRPVLEGETLNQHDITHWKGSIQQSLEYEEVHGEKPLWTNALFSGMPTFQIGYTANNLVPWTVHNIMSLWLPRPIQFFFLASVCFYILTLVLRIRPWIGILGSLAFAYATYNPVIISVGHETKMWSIAYMPALLGAVILVYQGRYWLGAALTAIFTSVLIAMNHPQIDYYFLIVAAVMSLFFIVKWIKESRWKHLAMSLGFTLGAAIIGVGMNAVTLFSTYEYQKATIRGGGSELADTTAAAAERTGLDKGYAFSYSMGIMEPFVLMSPRLFGGSSDKEEVKQEDSKAIQAIVTMPQELQNQMPLAYYWGDIASASGPSTSGPPYSGAIIVFLAILAMFFAPSTHKWWALTTIGIAILMSWGQYFEAFNNLLFEYLPFYNKFRAPSMIMVIPQLLLPMLAVLGLNGLVDAKRKEDLMPGFKKLMLVTGGVFVVLFGMYMSVDFLSSMDEDLLSRVRQMNNPELLNHINSFYDGLKEDRKGLMLGSIFRSLGFVAAAAALVFLFLRGTLSSNFLIGGLLVLSFADLIAVDSRYLNQESFQEPMQVEGVFQQTEFDQQVLQDTSYYRVLNIAGGSAFNENFTSYTYNSVGGYHAAKLVSYQDLIERKIGDEQSRVMQAIQSGSYAPGMVHTPVLNMLNTKYFIYKDNSGLTRGAWPNPGALGAAWLVKGIRFVENAQEEMRLTGQVPPADTAIVQQSYRDQIPFMPQWDSTGSISLIENDNDVVRYSFNAISPQFAVFSEVFYDDGWVATIDGKEAPIAKVNYVLRGLAVPAGKHEIEFRFEPEGYYKGRKLTTIFTVLLFALIAASIFMEWRSRKRGTVEEA